MNFEGETMVPLLAGRASVVHDDDYVTALLHGARLRAARPLEAGAGGAVRRRVCVLAPDLETDLGETTDLSASHPEVRREMIELWRSERVRLGIVLPESSAARPER